MAKTSTHDLKDILECSICMDEFSDPRMLPCIHTFCFKCLERTGQEKRPGEGMACPLCRKEFKIPENGIGGIQKNFFMESLAHLQHQHSPTVETKVFCDACLEDSDADIPQAVLFCVECKQRLCDSCCKAHRRAKILKQHQLINLEDKIAIGQRTRDSIQSLCGRHENEPIKMYCTDCKAVNCMVCQVECHQGHKCLSVREISDEFKLQLEVGIEKISSCVDMREEEMLKLDEENRAVLEKSKSLETDALKRAAYIKDIVDQHANKLLANIGERKVAKMKEIENKKEEVSRQIAMLESYKRYAGEMVKKGSHVDICRNFQDMKARSDELENNRNESGSDNIDFYSLKFLPSEIDDFLKTTIGKISDIPLVRKIPIGEVEAVDGVTWFEDKIYTINAWSKIARTFQDKEPFLEETPIVIGNEKIHSDIVADKVNRAIFICDKQSENHYLWKIEMPNRKMRRHKKDGFAWSLSITPSDDLLAPVKSRDRFYVNIYRSSDLKQLQSIVLPTEIETVYHAIQTTKSNFVVACANKNFPWRDVISELSMDGAQFIRTFDLQSIDSMPLKIWKPYHLSMDEDGNVFVADISDDGHRVFQLNSRLNRIEMELNDDYHQIDLPRRLCYVREKHMLIVGQGSLSTGKGSICVFEC